MPIEPAMCLRIDCNAIGSTVVAMGGGRRKLGDPIDPAVGVGIAVRIGDRVEKGQPLLDFAMPRRAQRDDYLKKLQDADGDLRTIHVADPRPLVLTRAEDRRDQPFCTLFSPAIWMRCVDDRA